MSDESTPKNEKPSMDEVLNALEGMLESYEMTAAHLPEGNIARGVFLGYFIGEKKRAVQLLKRAGREWPKKETKK